MKNYSTISIISFILLLFNGCSHSLTITNPDDYYSPTPMYGNDEI